MKKSRYSDIFNRTGGTGDDSPVPSPGGKTSNMEQANKSPKGGQPNEKKNDNITNGNTPAAGFKEPVVSPRYNHYPAQGAKQQGSIDIDQSAEEQIVQQSEEVGNDDQESKTSNKKCGKEKAEENTNWVLMKSEQLMNLMESGMNDFEEFMSAMIKAGYNKNSRATQGKGQLFEKGFSSIRKLIKAAEDRNFGQKKMMPRLQESSIAGMNVDGPSDVEEEEDEEGTVTPRNSPRLPRRRAISLGAIPVSLPRSSTKSCPSPSRKEKSDSENNPRKKKSFERPSLADFFRNQSIMNPNFPPFLDSPGGMANNVPRQAPSPTAGQPQANGVGATGMGLMNPLPSAGHQSDMNYLWSVVQQLSDVLAENRAQTAGIINGVQQIQARAAAEGGSPTAAQVNGELYASQSAEIASLQAQLSAAQRKIASLEYSYGNLQSLLNDYENALASILDKLRPYAYQHAQAITALHAHYNALLDTERTTNLELRLEHQAWQAGLGRVAEYARLALREHNNSTLPYIRKIAGLKTENRVLRSLAGWDSASDSSDDEAEKERKAAKKKAKIESVMKRDKEGGPAADKTEG